MNIKPIRTEAEYDEALERIDELWEAESGSVEADELDVLATLVEAYEAKHYPMPLPDPIEAILHEVESRGLKRTDLEVYIGSRGRVSEVLNRRRPLSLQMIRNLCRGLEIPAETLIQPYQVA